MSRRVAVAMSGGVDSSVAAFLLRREGRDVFGLHMDTGIEQAQAHVEDARRVAAQIGMPFHVVDLSKDFSREIIDHFCDEYCRGRTPNPCAVCNRAMKFGRLLAHAVDLGADALATGHYARVDRSPERRRLLRGADPEKDQSYFLFGLTQDQLARAVFPNGEKTKHEVRDIARAAGLAVREKAESQEICFIPDNEYRDLLRARRPGAASKGLLKDTGGAVLGGHEGFPFYTIGQRRGLGIAVGEPRYVVRIDPQRNEVIVGRRDELQRQRLVAAGVNWVSIPPIASEMRASVQIRYAHRAAPATLRPMPEASRGHPRIEVIFGEPQFAVTPGQAAVFYEGDVLLGGGWIE